MCRTKFSYYTNARSHSLKSDLRYSELPKMFPPSSAQVTKSQVQQLRYWRIKHGQNVANKKKTVGNMRTKDNPGTLPMNLYLTQQPTSQPFDFGKIGEVQGETTKTVVTARREKGRREGSSDLVQWSGDIVYLASDASS